MQSAVRPVSCGPRWTRYFSAPGLSCGPAGAAPCPAAPRPPRPPPPPKPYTPEKSGLPSGVRGIPVDAAAAGVPAAAGFVPVTVTVTDLVRSPIVSVYVVVAAGVTRCVPRGVTRPMPGSIAGAAGFSTSQFSTVDSPGLIVAGRASNVTMRGGGPPRPRPGGGACPVAGAPAAGCCPPPCGVWATTVRTAKRTQTRTASERLKPTSQNDPNDSNDPNAYERISRPSASFMRFAIIDGAPLFAGAPVADSGSPGFTVLLVQP